MKFTRRSMLASCLAAASPAARIARASLLPYPTNERRFTMDLNCGSIGVRADQAEAIRLAAAYGFESVMPLTTELARLNPTERRELADRLKEQRLVWGAAGLPTDFRNDTESFRRDVAKLPGQCEALQQAGVTRIGTWLMPCHDELTYMTNFRRHADRLRQCVAIMNDHGLRFGMEYVGPKTLWASRRYSFIHSMRETRDLIDEINLPGVGFVLDSWHWYTARETVDDLRSLSAAEIVACDLNDAPDGKEIDEQLDNQRHLPTATGVIDLAGFLGALVEIGYDGPVRAEPFNADLNAMDNEPAVSAVATAMKTAFALVD